MSIKEKKLKDLGPIFILLSLICLLLVSGSVLAQQDETNKLLGSWQRQSEGQQYVITFKPDGSGTLESGGEISSFQWNFKNNTLTMSGDGAQYINQIVITAETLTMTGKNMPGPVVWYRLPKMTDAQKQIRLIGRWKKTIEGDVQFNKDGTAIIDGMKYLFTVKDDTLTLTGSDGSIQIPYTLNGDVLFLTINGQRTTLHRSLPEK